MTHPLRDEMVAYVDGAPDFPCSTSCRLGPCSCNVALEADIAVREAKVAALTEKVALLEAILLARPTLLKDPLLAFLSRLTAPAVVIDLAFNIKLHGIPDGWEPEYVTSTGRNVVIDPKIDRLVMMSAQEIQWWAQDDRKRLELGAAVHAYQPGWVEHSIRGWRAAAQGAEPATRACVMITCHWRDTLAIHPATEAFPQLPADELRLLSMDIKEHGLQIPVAIWVPYTVNRDDLSKVSLLDGRNGLDAMELAGIAVANENGEWALLAEYVCEEAHLNGAGPDAYNYVISANIHRRHLSIEQKNRLTEEVLRQRPAALSPR